MPKLKVSLNSPIDYTVILYFNLYAKFDISEKKMLEDICYFVSSIDIIYASIS